MRKWITRLFCSGLITDYERQIAHAHARNELLTRENQSLREHLSHLEAESRKDLRRFADWLCVNPGSGRVTLFDTIKPPPPEPAPPSLPDEESGRDWAERMDQEFDNEFQTVPVSALDSLIRADGSGIREDEE